MAAVLNRPGGTLAGVHDIELSGLAVAGDRAAFGELVRRNGSAVRGLLRRLGAEPAVADDVTQDAFLAGFEQIADFRGEGTFQSWIKRIAARLYIRHWRKHAHLESLSDSPESLAEGQTDGRADRAEHLIDLDEALKTLSEAERLCVSLCFGGGLSHAEAADALNAPLGTVKSHVKRGLDKLRRRLTPPGGDGEAERLVHG